MAGRRDWTGTNELLACRGLSSERLVKGLSPWQLRPQEEVPRGSLHRACPDPRGACVVEAGLPAVYSRPITVRDSAHWLSLVHSPWSDGPSSRKASWTSASVAVCLSARKNKGGGQQETRREVNCLLSIFLEAVGLPRLLSGEESTWQCRWCRRREFASWVRKIPWRRKWQPAPVFLPWKPHGQRSLVGYSLWGRKELETTERLTHKQINISM